jgi:hypothetical protein
MAVGRSGTGTLPVNPDADQGQDGRAKPAKAGYQLGFGLLLTTS